jgi:hypothetical protein
MLSNRNNPMLSAITQGLNLGTRSFALAANMNNGDQSVRLRPDYSISIVRAGLTEGPKPPVGGYQQPSQQSGSPLVPRQPSAGCAPRERVEIVAEAPSERSVEPVGRKGWRRGLAWMRSTGTTTKPRRVSATGLMRLPRTLASMAAPGAMARTTLAAPLAARKGAATGG